MNGWEQLMVPRFKCGHERTPMNSYSEGKYARCKRCKDNQARNYRREHGR